MVSTRSALVITYFLLPLSAALASPAERYPLKSQLKRTYEVSTPIIAFASCKLGLTATHCRSIHMSDRRANQLTMSPSNQALEEAED